MKFRKMGKRILSLALSGVMLVSSGAMIQPVSAATAAFQPIQLEAAPTKIMDYFATQSPAGVVWITNRDALTFLPAAAIGDVTCAVKAADGAVWVGTENGLMRMDFSETDARDMVQYFSGNRYLYGGDDKVTGLAADADGGVWVRNAQGSVHIKMPKMTMEERTYFYEKMINDVNDRRGMVSGNNSYSYDPATDEYTSTGVYTQDNDGLWTVMYAMGEIFRYQTLKKQGAEQHEIDAAKAAAVRATKAVLLLDYVSGRGSGFPCRSYMLKDELHAGIGGDGLQLENGLWFEMRLLGDSETYPQPIIPELELDGKAPIGIATVRITKDALSKRGSQIFPQDTDYNGHGLSQSSINTFNTAQAAGQKLGTDIVSNNKNQVFPVMVEGVNIKQDYNSNTTPASFTPDKIKFRLTAPIYERIPTLFNDLFPDSAIGADGYVDESQIIYKADTSSDEVDGHYALFLMAYRDLCDEPGDEALKDIVAETALRMTDLILKDNRYYIVDATGKATTWSRWLARYFNDGLDMMKSNPLWTSDYLGLDGDGEDALSYGYEDGPLNALEVMAALKIASFIADGERDVRAATYKAAYDLSFHPDSYSGGGLQNDITSYVNGKGYMDMALEYRERRLIRQATEAYADNDNQAIREYTPGAKIYNSTLHNDWTQYLNYSDEELGWFPVYALVTLETDADRYAKIVQAFDQWYVGQEEREENPFYTFVYQLAHPEKSNVDLQSAVRFFYRHPLVRNEAMRIRGDRQDVFYIEAGYRDKIAQTNYALAPDERQISRNNSNPFAKWTDIGDELKGGGYTTAPYTYGSLNCGSVFTLSYWLGRYYGMITETEGSYYNRVTPSAILTATASAVTVTVLDGETPLSRMIVDFYEDGAYVGRARTDAGGNAVLNHTPAGEMTAIITERLIGKTMYNQANAQLPHPNAIHLSIPEGMEMVAGEHHSIDSVILPDSNPHRGISWSSSNAAVATVDLNGRVTAIGPGSATITAQAKADPAVTDSGVITVVSSVSALSQVGSKAVVNYGGAAAEEVENLQKYVDRYTKAAALADPDVPDTVKAVLDSADNRSTADVAEEHVTWSVKSYGILRTDTAPAHERDGQQLFMGSRYLPDGTIVHIESDQSGGLWAVSATHVTHIRMEARSYTDKAAEMSATTQENVARRGMVSQARWNGTAWVPEETDNDGLWTSMYGVGELMRYSVLKDDPSATPEEVAAAQSAALSSIKAVLLLSNITCRTGTVDAYIRPLLNDSNQYDYSQKQADNLLANSGLALLKGKDFSTNNPQSGPVGALMRVEGEELLAPFFPADWAIVNRSSNKADFATRTRTLEGMIARTYRLDGEFPGANFNDGYYWNIDGNTATCESTTSNKVRWESLSGTTVDASGQIPAAVADLLGAADKDNVTYKTDTSTDEIIGHLFIYKVAYDILDDSNPEEAAVKELLVDTVRRIAQHFADNGYSLRDATGQATTWGKTERDYFNNSYAWEDCALNSLVNLGIFKLASYVTGEARWENEYRMLALAEPYRYADLAGEYWDRWAHLAIVDGGLSENASQDEINTWIQQELNYSDEEMAMLAYYILFQMEDDSVLLGKYQEGLDSWWNSVQYSENPLWYYIYQLAYPNETQTDAYGNVLVDTAAWALSRHPIDTICWSAHNDDRPDAEQDGELSRDRETGEVRVVPQDERALHKFNGSTYELSPSNVNRMEGSTTYTLPYWMGRYHNMITPSNR